MTTLRDLLTAGVDPAPTLGSFDHLLELVVGAACVPIARRTERAVRLRTLAAAEATNYGAGDGVATTWRFEAELLEDPDLIGLLFDRHPRGAELARAVRKQLEHDSLSVIVVDDGDVAAGYPGACTTCAGPLPAGARALAALDARYCLPCVRHAIAGVDLDDEGEARP